MFKQELPNHPGEVIKNSDKILFTFDSRGILRTPQIHMYYTKISYSLNIANMIN